MTTTKLDNQLAIQTINLCREFNGKTAVRNLNLSIKQGEIYAFLGPNGAGKTTTLKILVTLLNSTSGSAYVLGNDVEKDTTKVRLSIGVALQEASLDESQTGLEFLKIQGRLYGLSRTAIDKRIEELLSLIDIGDAIKKQIKTYSGGMKRRLDLASSLIHYPKVLFLDEPTTGLDPISRSAVWKEIQKLNKDYGMTIILTTQYLEEADQLADRVGIINNGQLVKEGTPQELKHALGNDTIIAHISSIDTHVLDSIRAIEYVSSAEFNNEELTVITSEGSIVIGKIAILLDNNNIQLKSLTLRTTTLDDVFLDVTGNRLKL